MSSISAGTVNESATVLPVPVSWSESMSAVGSRVRLRLHPAQREEAPDDVAQVLGGRVVARFGAEGARHAAVDVTGRREPLDRGQLARDLARQLRLAREDVEAADGPGVVVPVDVGDELHHLVVAGDAVRGQLRVDGAS